MRAAVMIILKKKNLFLLGKRSRWKSKGPGYWCPLSGHIEINESQDKALVREAQEELGVEIKPVKKVAQTLTHDKSVILHWWLAEIIEGEPKIHNLENEQIQWFSKKELKTLSPVFEDDIKILLSL